MFYYNFIYYFVNAFAYFSVLSVINAFPFLTEQIITLDIRQHIIGELIPHTNVVLDIAKLAENVCVSSIFSLSVGYKNESFIHFY